MDPTLARELEEWKKTFQAELLAQLEQLRRDDDIYGFGVEVPEDLGNLGIATTAGRESKLGLGQKLLSLVWLDRRYSPVEWGDYLPNAQAYRRTYEQLDQISRNHRSRFISESSEYTDEGVEFRDALYAACLDAMAHCDSAGAFGHIWFKIIFLSDGEHPIVRESFYRLNRGRSLKEAARLYGNP